MRRDDFTQALDLGHELIVDNFAGGGGTSTGLETAFGRPVDIAINHDPEALAMHAINHPHTLHLCESVWDVNPITVTRNRPVALVWLSPDCKHFSRAKGGTPVAKHIRGLAWVGLRWAALTKPRVLMLENVEEFTTWGPLKMGEDGLWYPDPAKKGKTFESFVRQLRALGYTVDWRQLRACDNGAPTIRKRLFLVARRDGLPICWPTQTHGDPSSKEVLAGMLAPWRSAAECIDFRLPGKSIFDRKKPLVTNTLRRVAKGLWRHVLDTSNPFIVPTDDGCSTPLAPFIGDQSRPEEHRTSAASAPLRTQCAQIKGGHFNLTAAALAPLRGTSAAHMGGHSVGQPLSTVAASGTHHALLAAHLVDMGHGESSKTGAKRWSHGIRSLEQPLNTITAGNSPAAISAAYMTKFRFDSTGHDLRDPMHTVTANSFVKRPGGSVPMGVVAACLEQANGGYLEDNDGRSVNSPISTIASKGANQRLVSAYCVKYYSSGGQWQGLHEPMHTLPTKGRMGLVQIVQVPVDGMDPQVLERARRCARLLREYLPEHFTQDADIVLIGDYVLVDITLRMLKPRELFRAQAFPEQYIIEEIPDPALLFKDGVQAQDPLSIPRIPLTATAQVRMCGNSVSPIQAAALIHANFTHEQLIATRGRRRSARRRVTKTPLAAHLHMAARVPQPGLFIQ